MRWNVSRKKSRFLTIEVLFHKIKCGILACCAFRAIAVIVITAVEKVFVKGNAFNVFNQTKENSFFGIGNGAMNFDRIVV